MYYGCHIVVSQYCLKHINRVTWDSLSSNPQCACQRRRSRLLNCYSPKVLSQLVTGCNLHCCVRQRFIDFGLIAKMPQNQRFSWRNRSRSTANASENNNNYEWQLNWPIFATLSQVRPAWNRYRLKQKLWELLTYKIFSKKKYSFCCLITDIKRLSSNVDKM